MSKLHTDYMQSIIHCLPSWAQKLQRCIEKPGWDPAQLWRWSQQYQIIGHLPMCLGGSHTESTSPCYAKMWNKLDIYLADLKCTIIRCPIYTNPIPKYVTMPEIIVKLSSMLKPLMPVAKEILVASIASQRRNITFPVGHVFSDCTHQECVYKYE